MRQRDARSYIVLVAHVELKKQGYSGLDPDRVDMVKVYCPISTASLLCQIDLHKCLLSVLLCAGVTTLSAEMVCAECDARPDGLAADTERYSTIHALTSTMNGERGCGK